MSRFQDAVSIFRLGLWGLMFHGAIGASAAEKPNFIVILTDDQSWVGSSIAMIPNDQRTSSDYFQTPHMERIAQMGMRFTQGYSPAASCCPTRRAIQTGQSPARHEFSADRQGWTDTYRRQLNIPRMLKAADPSYVTAHFGKWDHRYDEIAPIEQDYDVSDGYTGNGNGGAKGSGGPAAQKDPKRIDSVTDRALEFIDASHANDQPFYLQVSHYAVHLDIFYNAATLAKVQASKSPGQKHNMPEFAAMTSDLDTGVGRLLDKLIELDLLKKSYLIFMSDNGGRTSVPKAPDSELNRNLPLRDGKHSFYEGGIRVPFMVLGPGVKPNSVCTEPVSGVDILPTLADLAGYPVRLPENVDGGSIRQVIHNEGIGTIDRPNPFLVFHQAVDRTPISAIRKGDYKLVKTWKKDQLELFNLASDLSEENDLSDRMQEKTQRLHVELTSYLDEVGASIPKENKRSSGKKGESVSEDRTMRQRRNALIAAETRPNVLFLAIDDLNDWVGALGGHPLAKTPHLDQLIARSVLFRNAHCAAPVCSASRHALLSGLRPSTTGWYSNSSKDFDSYVKTLGDTVPMPTHFKQNGYRTLAAGKIFHKGTSDVKDYDYWDDVRPRYRWPKDLASRGHGYQGKSGGHFHPFPRDGGAIYQKYQQGVDGQSLCWGALEQSDMPPEGMPDEQIADWAVDQLSRQHDEPIFLAVGFVRPHVPYTAPREFFDLYQLDDIAVPAMPIDEMDDVPLWGKAMAYGTIAGGDHANVLSIGPDYWREMVRAYLACVSFVDAQVGKVLRALESGPCAENTIVVFWSDHGQHLGEKRHWRKQALWEESTRVPLAIQLPRDVRGGEVCDRAVSLLDIYPTLLQLCDLPDVKGLEGMSLLPQLHDPKTRRTEPAITTWHYNNHAARSLNFRYIRYRDGSEELYDHRKCPNEHHNLASDPSLASIKQKLAASLPTQNVMPSSLRDNGLDSYGTKVQQLRDEGIPAWLGTDPSYETVTSTTRSRSKASSQN
ncbi:MAG: sulfatase-like hydrolase/transferase [Planctomycetota bacterium]